MLTVPGVCFWAPVPPGLSCCVLRGSYVAEHLTEGLCVLGSPCHRFSPSQGHSKSIQCLTVHKNGGKSYIYSGSHDGHINIL